MNSSLGTKGLSIVLDTNVWISEMLLRSHLGAALIYYVRASGGYLGLPEIVTKEIEKQIIKVGEEAINKITNAFVTLNKITPSRSVCSLPDREKLRNAVSNRMAELAPLLKHIPFTFDHAKEALRRVIEEIPPNKENNQQFKDSAIWESLLELSRDHRVIFVTKDKGFFENRDPSKGLAKVLREEITINASTLEAYYDLQECLIALRQEIPAVDQRALSAAIDASIRTNVVASSANKAFQVIEHADSKIEVFCTEKPSVLSIAFELMYQLQDAEGNEGLERTEAKVFVRGDCSYSLESKEVTDFRIDEEEFVWRDEHMIMQKKKNIYLTAHSGIKMKDVAKYALE